MIWSMVFWRWGGREAGAEVPPCRRPGVTPLRLWHAGSPGRILRPFAGSSVCSTQGGLQGLGGRGTGLLPLMSFVFFGEEETGLSSHMNAGGLGDGSTAPLAPVPHRRGLPRVVGGLHLLPSHPVLTVTSASTTSLAVRRRGDAAAAEFLAGDALAPCCGNFRSTVRRGRCCAGALLDFVDVFGGFFRASSVCYAGPLGRSSRPFFVSSYRVSHSPLLVVSASPRCVWRVQRRARWFSLPPCVSVSGILLLFRSNWAISRGHARRF